MVEVDPLFVESSGIADGLDSVPTLVLTVCSLAVTLAVVGLMAASVPLALRPLLCKTVLAV